MWQKNGIAGFHQPTDSNNGKKHLIKTILMSLIICNYRKARAKDSIFTTQFDYILMQFGVLNIRLGKTVITGAVVNDIMSLIVLSIILQVAVDGGRGHLRLGDLIVSEVNIAIFLGGIFCSTSCYGKLPAG